MGEYSKEIVKTTTVNGFGMGATLAIVISWSMNKSIIWAVVHGLFSWLYVLYYALFL